MTYSTDSVDIWSADGVEEEKEEANFLMVEGRVANGVKADVVARTVAESTSEKRIFCYCWLTKFGKNGIEF